MSTEVRMPETVEEAVRAINEALRKTGYFPYHHYDRQLGQWGWIILDPAKMRGDNPVSVEISIRPGAENLFVLKEIVDNYEWVVTNKLRGSKGEFTLTYDDRRAWLHTVVTTHPPDAGDITSTYRFVRKGKSRNN